jgi:NAD(P)-dependent dehydrogenase (short-subunit alcohol dehydrogenase family)
MDKVCAVFGGSRGIGRAVAQLMAQKGYRLAIVSRNLEVAKVTAGELGGMYRKCPRRATKVQVLEFQSTGPAHVPGFAPQIARAP